MKTGIEKYSKLMLINRNMSDLDGKIEIDYKVHKLKVVFQLNLSEILRSLNKRWKKEN